MLPSWRRILKLYRSAQLWGWRRTLVKAAGRYRLPFMKGGRRSRKSGTISVLGCGQAAFATLCYYLQRQLGNVFLDCYDPAPEQAQSLARFYRFNAITPTPEALLENPALQTLVIASNHASHTAYAVAGLKRHLQVFAEKPLCTTHEQLTLLRDAVRQSNGRLYAGYNRPFAPAIRWLCRQTRQSRLPFTLHACVHGHQLDADHWYRLPEEGTRIAGNMSHWIDLAVHLMHGRGCVPARFELLLHGAGTALPMDDNAVLVLTSDAGDLVSISLNARHEPFEGIRETLEFQDSVYAVQIDDFRRLRWWAGNRRGSMRYAPKDAGHKACALQPFAPQGLQRPWEELELTTALTLAVADLARAGGGRAAFDGSNLALIA